MPYGRKKQPISRASTCLMGGKEHKIHFQNFWHHPGPGRATCKCKYILSTSLVRASTCRSLLAGLNLRRLLAGLGLRRLQRWKKIEDIILDYNVICSIYGCLEITRASTCFMGLQRRKYGGKSKHISCYYRLLHSKRLSRAITC